MENGKNAAAADRLNSHTIISSLKIKQAKMDIIAYVKNAVIRKKGKNFMGEIYKIINDFNNKIYIGKAKNGAKIRWREHIKRDINNNQYIHQSMRKHGIEHFTYEILESNIPNEYLNEREKYYIQKYNCKTPNGYNETDGGDGGGDAQALIKWCQEHPEMVKRNRDNARIKAHQWQKDNKEIFSNIIRENQKKASEARKKKVKCIEKNIIFESASEAARQLNLSSGSHISAVCRGERKTAAGYHWEFIT